MNRLLSIILVLLPLLASVESFASSSYGSRTAPMKTTLSKVVLSKSHPQLAFSENFASNLYQTASGNAVVEGESSSGKSPMKKIARFFKDLVNNLVAFVKHVANIFYELYTGGFLKPQTELAHGEPLGGADSLSDDILELGIQERDYIIGSALDVQGKATGAPYCKVRGIELGTFGFERMRFYLSTDPRTRVCTLLNRSRSGFKLYRGKSEDRVGRIERVGEDYGFFLREPEAAPGESSEATKLADPEPAYKLSGNFIDHRFVMKNAKGEPVAKIRKKIISIPAFDHYTVRVAPGMDPLLVIACLYVIDEELEKKISDKAVGAATNTFNTAIQVAKSPISIFKSFQRKLDSGK